VTIRPNFIGHIGVKLVEAVASPTGRATNCGGAGDLAGKSAGSIPLGRHDYVARDCTLESTASSH